MEKPTLYQEVQGRRIPVEGGFVLVSPRRLAFHVGPHDPSYALVIDPVLSYATYFGSTGNEVGLGIGTTALAMHTSPASPTRTAWR